MYYAKTIQRIDVSLHLVTVVLIAFLNLIISDAHLRKQLLLRGDVPILIDTYLPVMTDPFGQFLYSANTECKQYIELRCK